MGLRGQVFERCTFEQNLVERRFDVAAGERRACCVLVHDIRKHIELERLDIAPPPIPVSPTRNPTMNPKMAGPNSTDVISVPLVL